MAKTQYTNAALLVSGSSIGRGLCAVVFWLWGLGGLVYLFPGSPGFAGFAGAGAVSSTVLYWIGGMLLFGVGGLLDKSYYDFRRPIERVEPSV